jgi:hypothetical protein
MQQNTATQAIGRKLSNFGKLSAAERMLRRSARKGIECQFGKRRPKEAVERFKIRAQFIRFLALGGDEATPVHEKGVQVRGAYIEGDLDLGSCKEVRPISIRQSLICGRVILQIAHTRSLDFDGSEIRVDFKAFGKAPKIAIDAAHAIINGSIYMRQEWDEELGKEHERFKVNGQVRLVSAVISGRLQCEGGEFHNEDHWALFCSRAKIEGGVYLGQDLKRVGSKPFEAFGAVRFRGVEIGGNLECENGRADASKVPANDWGLEPALCFDGAEIKGHVQLSGFVAKGKVDFLGASLGGEVSCHRAKFFGAKSKVGREVALRLQNAIIKGSLYLDEGFRAMGEVNLVSADIGGRLQCENGYFLNYRGKQNSRTSLEQGDEGSRALYFSGAKIAGGVLLNHAYMKGQVRFRNAAIGADLECDEAVFLSNAPRALFFDRSTIAGNVHMHWLRAKGQVRFASAKIGGDLRFGGAEFNCQGRRGASRSEKEENNRALFFSRARIEGTAFLQAVTVRGELRLRSAYIGGNLEFAGAKLEAKEKVALYLSNTTICGNVFFNKLVDEKYTRARERPCFRGGKRLRDEEEEQGCFRSDGDVRLTDVQVQGNLYFDGAQLTAGSKYALDATGAKIWRDVSMINGFRSKGAVCFEHATIEGSADCSGGDFSAKEPDSKNETDSDARNALSFRSSKIDNSLIFSDKPKPNASGTSWFSKFRRILASWLGIKPGDEQERNPGSSDIKGVLDLRDARVGALVDDKDSWPVEGNLRLDGFVYDRLAEGAPLSALERWEWLHRQPPEDKDHGTSHKPQPFEQLIKVLKQEGHRNAARDVDIWKQRHITRHAFAQRLFLTGLVRGSLDLLISYGYNPARILTITLLFWLSGALLYSEAYKEGFFGPTAIYFLEHKECHNTLGNDREFCIKKIAPEYVSFNSLVFSGDVILPIVNLRQQDAWQPMNHWLKISDIGFPLPIPVRGFMWIETLWGWLAALILTAHLGGVIKKE